MNAIEDADEVLKWNERMKFEDIPESIRKQMMIDELIFGNSFCLKKEDGTYERIDPCKVILNPTTKEFVIMKEKEWKE